MQAARTGVGEPGDEPCINPRRQCRDDAGDVLVAKRREYGERAAARRRALQPCRQFARGLRVVRDIDDDLDAIVIERLQAAGKPRIGDAPGMGDVGNMAIECAQGGDRRRRVAQLRRGGQSGHGQVKLDREFAPLPAAILEEFEEEMRETNY